MGKGQSLDASINYSAYSKSIELGFADPYFLDKPILFGGQLYRRDYRSFNFVGGQRNTTYTQVSTGGGLRTGFPLTEYWSVGTRYGLVRDKISLDKSSFYTDPDGAGPLPSQCDPLKAGQYLCDEVGKHTTSLVGYSTIYDDTDGIHPTRGERLTFSQDIAGLGGDVKYGRIRGDATKYIGFGGGWIFSAHAEGGLIKPFQSAPGPDRDAIRLTDRFFGPQLRGFDIRGIGPRVQRIPYNADGTLATDQARIVDSLGGRTYYMGRLELEFPVSSALRSAGLRPSIYADAGSLFNITAPVLENALNICTPRIGKNVPQRVQHPGEPACSATDYNISPGFKEFFLGDSAKPRVSVGVGVNWVSPFGPLRLDLAKALIKQEGDDTKLFQFNVGTQF